MQRVWRAATPQKYQGFGVSLIRRSTLPVRNFGLMKAQE
jgi:hypothetical protein